MDKLERLVEDIINDLMDNSISLSQSLQKTKVLAVRLKNKDLEQWVDKELNGYNDTDKLPDYRKNIYCDYIGDYINGNEKLYDQSISLSFLEKELKEIDLYFDNYRDAIPFLNELVKDDKKHNGSFLLSYLNVELIRHIQNYFNKMGKSHIQILNIYKRTAKNAIKNILFSVKNELLNFILALESELGIVSEIKDTSERNNTINKFINNYMSNTTINNSGDGNTINTGDGNQITTKVTITKNDSEYFKSYLQEYRVPEEDQKEILEIVKTEKPKEDENLGERAGQWVGKMIEKAINKTWEISTDIAAKVLIEGIKGYYGILN